MSWRLDNRRKWVLLGLAVLALALQALLEVSRVPTRQRDYESKLAAAERAAEAFAILRDWRQLSGAHLDLLNDPAGTGLIGPEFSPITNAQGNLEAKLTSLNPNWAAVLVGYFRQIGLGPGDLVAVALSGSFPGLNIALFAAMETMRLRPVVITSVGSSMWGANSPDYTWLDMETVLYDAGIFTTRSLLASYGGGNDMGRGLSPDGRRMILAAAERNGVPLLAVQNIEQAIAKRMAFYAEHSRGRNYRCFVNIGGGIASLGNTHNRVLLKSGLNLDLGRHNWPRKGTMVLFSEKGVPVIHFLRLVSLARQHGMPVSPDSLPPPGEGDTFVRPMYRLPLVVGVLFFYCLLCCAVLAPQLRGGLFDRLPGRRTATPLGKGAP